LLAGPDRPTAVLAMTDVVAAGVLSAAHEVGLRVPTDLAVVGFDDNPLAARTVPPLTTVAQDVGAKGRAAAAALRQAMGRAKDLSQPRPPSRTLPVRLVVRGSTDPGLGVG
jgi:DNA-binding LacI/PurR family transcriptional regulator